MRAVPVVADSNRIDCRQVRFEHHLVGCTLGVREAPVHREGARDVGRVSLVFATGIDEQQIAVVQDGLVLTVVQDATIGATAHDGQIRDVGAPPCELVTQFGLDLVLETAGATKTHRTHMGQGGNPRRLTHAFDFATALEETHFVEHMLECHHLVRRMTTLLGLGTQTIHPTNDPLIELAVVPDRVVELASTFEQAWQNFVDIVDRESIVGTVIAPSADRAGTTTVPGLARRISIAYEQEILALRTTGNQHGHRLGLTEARQIMEIAVLAIGELDVVVAHRYRCSRDDRNRVAPHRLHELTAATRKFIPPERR